MVYPESSFEFGPFRLDTSSGSLYCGNEFVPLTPKAFDTLRVLVEHAGQLVTKEELMARVWPDAHVEDGNLANNISVLRKVLNPHFDGDGPIATVARRGYRFTEPVRDLEAKVEAKAAKADLNPVLTTDRKIWFVAAAMLVAVAAIPVAIRVATAERAATPQVRRAVAVLSMKNGSGKSEHAWFATALSEAMNSELTAGGQLRIISGEAARQMQRDLGVQPEAGLSRKQLDDIGRSLGCDLILTGTYLHANGRVKVDLRLDDIATGSPVTTVSLDDAEDRLLDLVTAAGRDLRTRLGLTPPEPGEVAAVRAALSSNPDALRFYFLGLEALRNHEIPRSTELLRQAIDADPNFALAHSVISISWRVLGYDDKSMAAAKNAFQLAPGLGREDRLAVEGAYYEVIGDVPKAIEKFQALWNFFPDNIAYGLKLVHQQLLGGNLEAARRTLDQMRALPPPADADPRVDVVESDWYHRKGQYSEAIQVATAGAEKASRRKSTQLRALLTSTAARSAMKLGDLDGARVFTADARQLYEALGDQGGTAETLRIEAQVLESRGELGPAKQLLDRAEAIAEGINHSRLLMQIRLTRANVWLRLGDVDGARKDAQSALVIARTLNHRSLIARALTVLASVATAQGDARTARAYLDEAKRIAHDTGEAAIIVAAAKES
jgi:DNA-binding winged helix-turn-helix (wHTH) protein/tetratricopeptide (TPR) repeat protein